MLGLLAGDSSPNADGNPCKDSVQHAGQQWVLGRRLAGKRRKALHQVTDLRSKKGEAMAKVLLGTINPRRGMNARRNARRNARNELADGKTRMA